MKAGGVLAALARKRFSDLRGHRVTVVKAAVPVCEVEATEAAFIALVLDTQRLDSAGWPLRDGPEGA